MAIDASQSAYHLPKYYHLIVRNFGKLTQIYLQKMAGGDTRRSLRAVMTQIRTAGPTRFSQLRDESPLRHHYRETPDIHRPRHLILARRRPNAAPLRAPA